MGIIEKFFHRFSLYKGILVATITTSIVWLLLCLMYLPYELFWSKAREELQGNTETRFEMNDDNNMKKLSWRRVDQVAIVVILFLLFTDCMLLVGIRRKLRPKPYMIAPWLFLYSWIIPTIPVLSLIVGLIYGDFIFASILLLPMPFYSYLWIAIYSYRSFVLNNHQLFASKKITDYEPWKEPKITKDKEHSSCYTPV